MMEYNIGFIGGGNMSRSIVGGMVATGYSADRIWVSDPDTAQLDKIQKVATVNTTQDNLVAIENCDCLVLAVKPQVMKEVISPFMSALKQKAPLIISIAAGIRCESIAGWLGGYERIIRVMPNTPSLVQKGAAGLFALPGISSEEREFAGEIMSTIGISTWVSEESLMDAVTALSGSGPAYFFLVMEAMIAAGQELGLSESTARTLTIQTALGAASLASQSDADPCKLRQQVTSKGGTTEKAIASLSEDGLMQIFNRALESAAKRSRELGDQLHN